ncbi:MAG: hypothetical protein ACPGU7_09905 [Gammaproteobacteria bacterium]
MPFFGVLPERSHLFTPQPRAHIGVNDAHAWRLNPRHHQVYDKLGLALCQGLVAAPCGVSPTDCGLAGDTPLMVKPITNLAGMSLGARVLAARDIEPWPGHFWSPLLEGPQFSTDALLLDGTVVWSGHTHASEERDAQRPIHWSLGVEAPDAERCLHHLAGHLLRGYTGLCNLETIGGKAIEMHLRGSNGFLDFYPEGFVQAWVNLVDDRTWPGLNPLGEAHVLSLFGRGTLPTAAIEPWLQRGVSVQVDGQTSDRIAIIRCSDGTLGRDALESLRAAVIR